MAKVTKNPLDLPTYDAKWTEGERLVRAIEDIVYSELEELDEPDAVLGEPLLQRLGRVSAEIERVRKEQLERLLKLRDNPVGASASSTKTASAAASAK